MIRLAQFDQVPNNCQVLNNTKIFYKHLVNVVSFSLWSHCTLTSSLILFLTKNIKIHYSTSKKIVFYRHQKEMSIFGIVHCILISSELFYALLFGKTFRGSWDPPPTTSHPDPCRIQTQEAFEQKLQQKDDKQQPEVVRRKNSQECYENSFGREHLLKHISSKPFYSKTIIGKKLSQILTVSVDN